MSKALSFAKRIAKLLTRSPEDLRHVLGVANWAAGQIEDPVADIRSIPAVNPLDICPGTNRWS